MDVYICEYAHADIAAYVGECIRCTPLCMHTDMDMCVRLRCRPDGVYDSQNACMGAAAFIHGGCHVDACVGVYTAGSVYVSAHASAVMAACVCSGLAVRLPHCVYA